jgi:hypothetical protein
MVRDWMYCGVTSVKYRTIAKLLAYNQDIKVQSLKDVLRELNCRIIVCRLLLTKRDLNR